MKELSKKSTELLKRFKRLKSSCTTKTGNRYLEPPDDKDSRWGLSGFGGCNPITESRAEQIIGKIEIRQSKFEGSE